jgi:hypothetical protein
MDQPRNEIENAGGVEHNRSDIEADTGLSDFFKFPSLGRLFQGEDRTALTKIRARLTLSSQDLDRVIRQGTKADADRAIIISRSYGLALSVLDELEQHVTRK